MSNAGTLERFAVVLASLLCIPAISLNAQGLDLKGQLSAWGTGTGLQENAKGDYGLRFIPQFSYGYVPGESDLLNVEVLLNTYYQTDFHSDDHDFKLYRSILRYTTTQTEIQLGLQKINFGPAQLLRPLMWFDSVDPRDPLKLTDGVYAARYKYSLMDNSILWLWGLYGNIKPKGYEAFRTAGHTPEFGGRYQLPVPAGEIAATFHTRKTETAAFEYRENRYAVDGRWDVGIGIWIESVWQQNISAMPLFQWNRMTAVGGDYTISAGNGIYVLAEHMSSTASNVFWSNANSKQVSALMVTYPVSVLDNVMVQEYYNWQALNLIQYYQWQRTYDNFIINCGIFHYPADSGNSFSFIHSVPVSGYGIQLLLIYNY